MLLIGLGAGSGFAAEWRPPERFLNAVRFVESSNGRFVYGDEGRSLGDYQLSKAAWKDVNGLRRAHGGKVYEYRKFVFDRQVSRSYAADYLVILEGQLRRELRRRPNFGELYAAYNVGFSSFAQCQFKLSRVNDGTQRKCRQIQQFMERGAADDAPAEWRVAKQNR